MKDTSLAEILAAVTSLAFLLTVSYGYGFSESIGFSIFDHFTVNDYFRQAVVWLPPAGVFLCFALLGGELLMRAIVKRTRHPVWGGTPSFTDTVALILVIIPGLILVAVFLRHLPRILAVVAGGLLLMVLWFEIVRTYLDRAFQERWKPMGVLVFVCSPLFLLIAFALGFINAEDTHRIHPVKTDTRIVLKDQPQLLTGTILLSLDQFLLLRDDDNQQVKVIPQSEIKQIIHDN